MRRYLLYLLAGLALALSSACGSEEHAEGADPGAGEALSEAPARPMETAARERLAEMALLPGSVAGRLRDYVAENSDVYDYTEVFQYVRFEPGKVIIEENSEALTEIDELALFLNANPLMNVELVTYAAEESKARRSAKRIADMRGMYLKSRLIDKGVEQQMVNLRSVVLAPGAGSEPDRVEVVLKGQ